MRVFAPSGEEWRENSRLAAIDRKNILSEHVGWHLSIVERSNGTRLKFEEVRWNHADGVFFKGLFTYLFTKY